MTKTYTRAIGTTDETPLVVKTADLARFLHRHIPLGQTNRPNYEMMVERIKALKESGRVIHGVSYEVLKRIYEEAAPVTADTCADEILVACGATDELGKDIPLYRNPGMNDSKYRSTMKDRLQDDWNEEEDLEYIESFPKMNTPL
jgi:hypothetical protein